MPRSFQPRRPTPPAAATVAAALLTLSLCPGCQSHDQKPAAVKPERDTELARKENDHAFKLIQEGHYEDAEAVLKRAITADVTFGPARNNLGLVYYHQNRLYDAAWEFENAIKLLPYQPEPRNNLGLVLEKAGKIDNAADSYAAARDMQPDNPEFIGNLARARVRRGDRDGDTRRLLEEILVKDARPQWREWAQANLFRLNQPLPTPSDLPTTRHAEP